MSRRPLLISHRTQMGTEPENTLQGIAAALASDVDAIECDLRAAADGAVMLLHDERLTRTTGDPRALADVTEATTRGLHVRHPDGSSSDAYIPSLAEALAAVSGRCCLVLEVKERGLSAAIARSVRQADAADWCWLWSFDPDTITECRASLPSVPASLLVAPVTSLAASIRTAVGLGCVGLSLHSSLATADSIDEAHCRGLSVYTWTVNDEARARTLADADIDAVCTDFPQRLGRVVRGDKGVHREGAAT